MSSSRNLIRTLVFGELQSEILLDIQTTQNLYSNVWVTEKWDDRVKSGINSFKQCLDRCNTP